MKLHLEHWYRLCEEDLRPPDRDRVTKVDVKKADRLNAQVRDLAIETILG